MRPKFEKRYENEMLIDQTMLTTTVRMPELWAKKVGLFAKFESDRSADLLREAVMRLIDDREGDPEYMAKLPKAEFAKIHSEEDQQIAILEQALKAARARRSGGSSSGSSAEKPSNE